MEILSFLFFFCNFIFTHKNVLGEISEFSLILSTQNKTKKVLKLWDFDWRFVNEKRANNFDQFCNSRQGLYWIHLQILYYLKIFNFSNKFINQNSIYLVKCRNWIVHYQQIVLRHFAAQILLHWKKLEEKFVLNRTNREHCYYYTRIRSFQITFFWSGQIKWCFILELKTCLCMHISTVIYQ